MAQTPHESFTEINLISAKPTPGASLKAIKHSKSSGHKPWTTLGELTVLPGSKGREGWVLASANIPPEEPHSSWPFEVLSYDLWPSAFGPSGVTILMDLTML